MIFLKKFLYKKLLFYSLFFIIFLIGFLVRVWNLDKNPAGFFCDEASIGYNAFSILKTGHDEWGIKYPIFFRAFGEYKDPMAIYFTVPFVAFFGLNEFAVRFACVFFSLLSLIVLYYIGREIKDKKFGLLLMFIFVINPWSIHFSRINFGFQILIFFFLISIFFLIKYYKDNKIVNLTLFSIFCSLTNYSYFASRIIISPFFITIIFLNLVQKINLLYLRNFFQEGGNYKQGKFLKIKRSVNLWLMGILILIYVVILIPLIFHLNSSEGLNRWKQVNIFNQKNINPTKKFIISYLFHFSLDFLFLKGDIDMPGQFITRHSVSGIGQLYLWQLPFIILGFYYLIIKKSKIFLPFFLLLFLYPIPSSLTMDIPPQATRSILGVIPFTFLTAIGVDYFFIWLDKRKLFKKLKHKIFLVFFLIILYSFFYFIQVLNRYPLYSSDFWGFQYGPKEIIGYFLENKDKYDEFYMSGEFNGTDIFLKFYDPQNKCQNKCKIGDLWGAPEIYDPQKKQLFSLSPDYLLKSNFKNKFKIKKIVYYPNGKEAFLIGEVVIR